MSIGSLVSSAVGKATGSSKTGLKDFLSKFSASGGEYIRSIDPLNTFELTFKFHPNKIEAGAADGKEGFLSKLGTVAGNIGKDIVNNVTGGLLGNLFDKSIMDERNNFGAGIH